MKYLLTIFSILLIVSCTVRRSEPLVKKTFVPQKSNVARGETIFMEYCHKCHPGGEAGLGPSIISLPSPQFVKRFQIRHGLGVMPSFKKDELSKKDVHDITAYLKAWKKY